MGCIPRYSWLCRTVWESFSKEMFVEHKPPNKLQIMAVPTTAPRTPSILKEVFSELMVSGVSKQRKQLRNDVLMICSLIVQECPDAPFVVSSPTLFRASSQFNAFTSFMYALLSRRLAS